MSEMETTQLTEEQFVSGEQQRVAATFGMWVFLATEVLFFGGLIVVYSAYRIWYPHDFTSGSRSLDFALGTTNTAILLSSSFFMAGAVTARRFYDFRVQGFLLILTALLGMSFLCIKGYEWTSAIHDGYWPTGTTQPHGVDLFYSLYFAMTGLHGVHLIIGLGLIFVTAARRRRISEHAMSLLGLYWHFVDIVWIFLYPLLYFIGRST